MILQAYILGISRAHSTFIYIYIYIDCCTWNCVIIHANKVGTQVSPASTCAYVQRYGRCAWLSMYSRKCKMLQESLVLESSIHHIHIEHLRCSTLFCSFFISLYYMLLEKKLDFPLLLWPSIIQSTTDTAALLLQYSAKQGRL